MFFLCFVEVVYPPEDLGFQRMVKVLRWAQSLRVRFEANVLDEVNKSQGSSHSFLTAFVGYLQRGGQFGSAYAMIVVVFIGYSCRILVVPMWTQMIFIPIISPLYKQQVHWLSSTSHFRSILLHVGCGAIALVCGLVQFNAHIRHNYRALHRWLGRVYVLSGVVCVHSLWQLQGIVGKGPSRSPSLLVQSFTLICIGWWSICTGLAVYYALESRYDEHKQWMVRSYCLLTVPLIQRSVNVALSFMLYWAVAAYAIAFDINSCYTRPETDSLDSSSESSTAHKIANFFDCILKSSPKWSAESGVPMLSLEGFGYTEHLVFGASAWFALGMIVYISEVGAASVRLGTKIVEGNGGGSESSAYNKVNSDAEDDDLNPAATSSVSSTEIEMIEDNHP